ncbi:hypothetical protein [Ralstonia solanacearum]|nr:hypothetical protein [Ralstonia solanacearum]
MSMATIAPGRLDFTGDSGESFTSPGEGSPLALLGAMHSNSTKG